MRTSLSFFFLLLPVLAMAQAPVLTASTNAVAGDRFTIYRTDTFVAGFGGTGVTWHFDTLATYSTDTVLADTCSASPYCAFFPGSNLYTHRPSDTFSSYCNVSSTVFSLTGGWYTDPIPYDNPEDLLRFPLTMPGSFKDTFSAYFTSAGYSYHRWGTIQVTADAWGTLILPGGTYSNVLRVRTNEYFDDSTMVSGSPFAWHYNTVTYTWYAPDVHVELLNLGKTYRNGMLVSISSYFTKPFLVAVKDPALQDAVAQLYPNPATNEYTIHSDAIFATGSWAELYDMRGALVSRHSLQGHDVTVPVGQITPGLYQCRIYVTGKGVEVKKLVVVK